MTNEEFAASVDLALHEVNDPEAGINIVDLGLIYAIEADASTGSLKLVVTFTSPACPAGDALVAGIERRLARIPEIRSLDLQVSFDPPWTPERISAAGKLSLGWKE
jgi:metal-sulfur cluster biosynthetic enzyme